MRPSVVLENIEDMRTREGISDDELRETIRALRVGDFVKLTFLTGRASSTGETLTVRVTRINGDKFLGKLVDGPALGGLSRLRVGSSIAFDRGHIHSVPKRSFTGNPNP
jgi:hypothetical protein